MNRRGLFGIVGGGLAFATAGQARDLPPVPQVFAGCGSQGLNAGGSQGLNAVTGVGGRFVESAARAALNAKIEAERERGQRNQRRLARLKSVSEAFVTAHALEHEGALNHLWKLMSEVE